MARRSDMMTDTESLKRRGAKEAVKNVTDGEVIGLGSGTTVRHFIEELARRIRSESLKVLAVPTSYDSLLMATENGIQLTTLDEHPKLSKCFDGADKVDKDLDLIKGGGGCHTREKIIASASETRCILVDHTKLVNKLTGEYPIPLEIIPLSYRFVVGRLSEEGGVLNLRYAGSSKMGPVIGDNGGFIGDVIFPKRDDVSHLDSLLNSIPGIIEHGLFLNMADLVYVGYENRVEILERKQR